MRKISKKQKKRQFLLTYLDERCSEADPGLVFGWFQNFTKKNEHRNDVISRNIMIQQESSR